MTTIYPSRQQCVQFNDASTAWEGVLKVITAQVSVEDQVDEVDEWNRRARTVFAP